MRLEIADDSDALAEEWDDLADRTGADPFLHRGWIAAWRRAFGRGRSIVLVVRRNGRLSALLPMEARGSVLRSPTNPHTPHFGVLADDIEARRMLLEGLFSRGSRVVTLGHLAVEGGELEAVRAAARAAGYREVAAPAGRSPYVPGRANLAEHERSLGRNLRHDVARRLRRLEATGVVTTEVSDGSGSLEALLEEGFAVEARGWKGERSTAIVSRPDTHRFYTEVARWAAAAGILRLAFLRVDGRAIAFQLDLESSAVYYSLKIGYDPAYERFSPGKLLAYSMVSSAISRGLASYELLGVDEPWKERFTATSREYVTAHAFAPSGAGRLSRIAYVHGLYRLASLRSSGLRGLARRRIQRTHAARAGGIAGSASSTTR